jgi:hypothetical protein
MDELQIETMKKVWFWFVQSIKSKTLWWNFLNLLLLSLEIIWNNFYIDPKWQITIMALINLYLRYLTTKPVSAK